MSVRDLLAGLSPDIRAACLNAYDEGRARALGVDLPTDGVPARAPSQARPAATAIPIHPETPPKWWLEERRLASQGRARRSRRGQRQLEVAQSIATGSSKELERELYRERMRAHHRAHARRWRYLPAAPARDGVAQTRPATAQQLIAARSALADEWGCRAAVVALPAPMAAAISAWVDGLPSSSRYGSTWSSRLVRRTVSTLCSILYASRPSWRDGYALVTIGMGRERLAGIMGAAPESGREFSVSSLSQTELGSLAILERLGILERTQLPGDAVPGCDRGPSGFAFNHYLFPPAMVASSDGWGDPSKPNPSLPRELLEHVAPWLALDEKSRDRVELARAAALSAALERLEGSELEPMQAHELEELEELEEREELEELERAPEHPPPLA